MNAGIIMQRVLRVLDSTDMRSLSSCELAETITAAILDLPEQYWACAPEPERQDAETPEADRAGFGWINSALAAGSTPYPCDVIRMEGENEVLELYGPWFHEEACPGHVASKSDPKVCGRCGIHIDSLRPPEEDEP